MPKVSWVVPVYNGDKYLDLALASIRRQTFDDFEVLVLDDGSTDQSAAIAQRCSVDDPRFRLISKPNTGLIDTLNVGLAEAKGEYICRLDCDDIALPDRCKIQVEFLDRNPDCVVVGSRAILIDEDGEVTGRSGAAELQREGKTGFPPARQTLRHPTVMGRRNAFVSLGGYSQFYPAAEDYELWLRMRSLGDLVELDDYLIEYRYHDQSISSRHALLQVFSCTKAEIAVHLRSQGGDRHDLEQIEAADGVEALFELVEAMALPGISVPSLKAYYWARALRLMRHRGRALEARAMAADLQAILLRYGIATLVGGGSDLMIDAAKELARYWFKTAGRRVA